MGTENSSSPFPQHRRRFLKWEARGDKRPWKVTLSCDRAELGKHIFRSAALFSLGTYHTESFQTQWLSEISGESVQLKVRDLRGQSEQRTPAQTRRLSKEAKDINHTDHNLSTKSNASNQDSVSHFHAWVLSVKHSKEKGKRPKLLSPNFMQRNPDE